MGEIKSKTSQNFSDREAWWIKDRQDNVNRLIRRINMKAEEPLMIISPKGENRLESKKRSSFRKKDKKKQENLNTWKNNNNVSKNTAVIIDRVPLKNGEFECCETTAETGPRQNDDVDNANETFEKKDSIDNIIDMIVSKSMRRDETLQKLKTVVDETRILKRSRSYHGNEAKKIYLAIENVTNVKPEEKSLAERLENLEKRAVAFEMGTGKMEDWLKKSGIRRQRSRCSAASEEFERNMIEALEENYKNEESLTELKTIERVKPFEKTTEKDKLIAAAKADPIIRNTIRKILNRVSKSQKVELDSKPGKSCARDGDESKAIIIPSGEMPFESGWVTLESPGSQLVNGVLSNGNLRSGEPLVKSNLISTVDNSKINGVDGKRKTLSQITGKLTCVV